MATNIYENKYELSVQLQSEQYWAEIELSWNLQYLN